MAKNTSRKRVHVLVIPFPAHGHMIPLLDLAHVLSTRYGTAVTVAVTPANRPRLSSLLARSPAIETLVLPFPDYPALPPGIENAGDVVVPYQFLLLLHALAGLHEPLLRWARAHPEPPTVVLSDMFAGWSRRLADDLGVPRISFNPSGAAAIAIMNYLWREVHRRSNPDDPMELLSVPSLPNSPTYHWYQLCQMFRSYVPVDAISEFLKELWQDNLRSWGHAFNTFSGLELVHLDHIKKGLQHSRIWAVGPLAPQVQCSAAENGGSSSLLVEELTSWLDGLEGGSVVYIAFGSLKVLSAEQTTVVAAALERSGCKFVWSARGGVAIPEGFEARVAGRGVVIRNWAPQMAILNHPAVGAFLTHCGWNSVLEATAAGVTLLMWPMGADQFTNAMLMAGRAGTGMIAYEGGPGSAPDPDDLARLLADSVGEAGKERRKKASMLKETAARAVREGGDSYQNLAAMVGELRKLAAAKN